MSGQSGDKEDRTEEPTSRRLEKAHEEGQVAISREAVLLAGLAAVALTFLMGDRMIVMGLVRSLSVFVGQPGLQASEPIALFHQAAMAFLAATAPFLVPITLAAAAATLVQTRFAMKSNALKVDFSRMSPGKGLKRMFGSESLVDTVKSLAKLAIVGGAMYHVLRQELPRMGGLPAAPLTVLPGILTSIVIRLLLAVVLAQAVITGVDIFWQRRQHHKQLRMSLTDIKDEVKESEGDPAIKMRIRRIRMRRARQRMLAAVSTATVVVTNPTHYAVALSYDAGKSSVPRMVAKGVDSLAARIRDEARKHGVPIVENPPLARALHQLPLDTLIPPELYKTVAELIAYVWRLSGLQRS